MLHDNGSYKPQNTTLFEGTSVLNLVFGGIVLCFI